jgi:hypothetical protein
MGLMDPDEKYKKPSYYNYKMMREKVDGFISVQDLSRGDLKLFDFKVSGKDIYIAWNTSGDTTSDLSASIAESNVTLTHIVTELDSSRNPVYPGSETVNIKSVPLSLTPVFIELLP